MVTEADVNRYSIAYFDWTKAVEYLHEAEQHASDSLVYEALCFAAIVAYYRPFSPNERGKNPTASSSLTIEDFPLDPDELALHGELKLLRNKALAHSEHAHNPTSVRPKTGVIRSRPFDLRAHQIDPKQLLAVLDKLLHQTHNIRAAYSGRVRSNYTMQTDDASRRS